VGGEGSIRTNVIYMGDDIPDLDCMREVGLPVCPADAAAEVIEASRYVSEFRGGEGAVRDIVAQCTAPAATGRATRRASRPRRSRRRGKAFRKRRGSLPGRRKGAAAFPFFL